MDGEALEGVRVSVAKQAILTGMTLAAAAFAMGRMPRPAPELAQAYPNGLRFGYAVEAPYAFVDESGRLTGAIPELARLVARRLDLPVTFVQTDFAALLDQLEEQRFDVVVSGLFITPERAKRVRFSTPTFRAGDAALVRRGNPKQLHSLQDVNDRNATVAVLASSVEEALARRAGIPRDRILVVPDAAAARRAVESGHADLLLNSEPTVRWIASRDMARVFDVADPFQAGEAATRLGAFALRQNDLALAEAWNRALDHVVGSPEHLALVEPFGFTHRFLPPDAKTSLARTTP